MKCAWENLLRILPLQLQQELTELGSAGIQEIRIRQNGAVEAVMQGRSTFLNSRVVDFSHIINLATGYSPWAQQTLSDGFLTISGGHRIGVCGTSLPQGKGYAKINSLCIRVARDFPGIAKGIPLNESILILGPPGYGKTTLLRDLIRRFSAAGIGGISVVDERGEVFGDGAFDLGPRTDVLSYCPKTSGILQVLKTMSPRAIAVDEITSQADCDALLESARCGVKLIATAHASDPEDLKYRKVYRPIYESGIFETFVVLQQSQTWRLERMKAWITNGSAEF